jgi:hypothetical protein
MSIQFWLKIGCDTLRDPEDRALKADRSLINPIIELKADCPKI